ncbi:MAG: acetyl-CoA synthetase, partial [Candidatus Azotimanducaceae bacterium]
MADHIVPVKPHIARHAHVRSFEQYQRIYDESIRDPSGFWRRQAERLDWFHPFDRTCEVDFNKAEISWYLGG